MAPQRDHIFKQKVNDCVKHIILQNFTNFNAIRSWSFQNICNEIGWPRFFAPPCIVWTDIQLDNNDVTRCCGDWHFIDLWSDQRDGWLRQGRGVVMGGNIQWRFDEDVNIVLSCWTSASQCRACCFSALAILHGQQIFRTATLRVIGLRIYSFHGCSTT